MSKILKQDELDLIALEERKVRALEKIAASVDALTIWFEEVDKDDWSERIQFYLNEFHKFQNPKDPTVNG